MAAVLVSINEGLSSWHIYHAAFRGTIRLQRRGRSAGSLASRLESNTEEEKDLLASLTPRLEPNTNQA